jgi:hypothetical protein
MLKKECRNMNKKLLKSISLVIILALLCVLVPGVNVSATNPALSFCVDGLWGSGHYQSTQSWMLKNTLQFNNTWGEFQFRVDGPSGGYTVVTNHNTNQYACYINNGYSSTTTIPPGVYDITYYPPSSGIMTRTLTIDGSQISNPYNNVSISYPAPKAYFILNKQLRTSDLSVQISGDTPVSVVAQMFDYTGTAAGSAIALTTTGSGTYYATGKVFNTHTKAWSTGDAGSSLWPYLKVTVLYSDGSSKVQQIDSYVTQQSESWYSEGDRSWYWNSPTSNSFLAPSYDERIMCFNYVTGSTAGAYDAKYDPLFNGTELLTRIFRYMTDTGRNGTTYTKYANQADIKPARAIGYSYGADTIHVVTVCDWDANGHPIAVRGTDSGREVTKSSLKDSNGNYYPNYCPFKFRPSIQYDKAEFFN